MSVVQRRASLDAEISKLESERDAAQRQWNDANNYIHYYTSIGNVDGIISYRTARQSAQDTRQLLESRIEALKAERDRL